MSAVLSPTPSRPRSPGAPRHETVQSGGVRLAVTRWGDPRRPTIVLVHGYPDSSHIWHPVAERLAADFHVVAYDVRGAGESDKPRGLRAYRLDRLRADFEAVISHVSPQHPVHLVAHDWGSIQSWESVTEPALKGRIASFTSCSGPCLDHMGHWFRRRLSRPTPKALWQVLSQSVRSWYIYFFHLPVLPGLLWRVGLSRLWPSLVRWTEGTRIGRNPTQLSDGQTGVQLYRANMFPRLWFPRERHAHAPVQVLVPTRDRYVSAALTEDLHHWVPLLWRREVDAGHWLIQSHPKEFAGAVRRFVRFVDRRAL